MLDQEERPVRSAFVPILLIALSVTAWFGFQTLQLVREQQQLEAAKVSLGAAGAGRDEAAHRAGPGRHGHGEAGRAKETSTRASIVEQLRSRGVTINSPAASAPR